MSMRRSKKLSGWQKILKAVFSSKKKNGSKKSTGIFRSMYTQRIVGLFLLIGSVAFLNIYIFYFRKQTALPEIIKMAQMASSKPALPVKTSETLWVPYLSYQKIQIQTTKSLEENLKENTDMASLSLTQTVLGQLQRHGVNFVQPPAGSFFWFKAKTHRWLLYPQNNTLWVLVDCPSQNNCISSTKEATLQEKSFDISQNFSQQLLDLLPKYVNTALIRQIKGSVIYLGNSPIAYKKIDGFTIVINEQRESWVQDGTEYFNQDGHSFVKSWQASPVQNPEDYQITSQDNDNARLFTPQKKAGMLKFQAICAGQATYKNNAIDLVCGSDGQNSVHVTYQAIGFTISTKKPLSVTQGQQLLSQRFSTEKTHVKWQVSIKVKYNNNPAQLEAPYPKYSISENKKTEFNKKFGKIFPS